MRKKMAFHRTLSVCVKLEARGCEGCMTGEKKGRKKIIIINELVRTTRRIFHT